MKLLRAKLFRLIITAGCLLLFSRVGGQTIKIQGTAKDSSGLAIVGANITILNSQESIAAYSVTNKDGFFSVEVDSVECVWIEITSVGYKRHQIRFNPATFIYSFVLQPEAKLLAEVTVTTHPPTQLSGDTLKYFVKNFATKEDRTIADVLRRMPGLEISRDGSIYFNGKKIHNLYIDGDDLMDGRYGSAVKVIKKELIESVDVIKHHQPISVLKDKVFTDDIGLNLVLQDGNSLKLSTSVKAGVGTPTLAEASIVPILLSKKIKTLNQLAYNSSGIDYRSEIKKLGTGIVLDDFRSQRREFNLSLGSVAVPDVPLPYYYRNQSALLGFNTLYKTKSGLQFKLTGSGLIDKNRLNYQAETINFLADDTITYFERQSTTRRPTAFALALSIMSNKAHHFFSHSLSIEGGRESSFGFNRFNNTAFGQGLQSSYQTVANDFHWMPAIRNGALIEVRWSSSFHSKRQSLGIGRDYYFDIPPQQGKYDSVFQALRLPLSTHHAYLAYKIPGQVFFQEYRLGYTHANENLDGRLGLLDRGITSPYAGDPGNRLTLRNKRPYLFAKYQLKIRKVKAEMAMPLIYQKLSLFQPAYAVEELKTNLLFQPGINLSYAFQNEKNVKLAYQLENNFSDAADVYRGGILVNYRSFGANLQGLQQEVKYRSSVHYYHQKSVKLFYFNAGLSHEVTKAGATLSDSFSNNIRRSVLVSIPNRRFSTTLNLGLSQYLFKLKMKLGIKAQARETKGMQILNSETIDTRLRDISLNTSIDKKISRTISFSHAGFFSWLKLGLQDKLKAEEISSTNAFNFEQKANLSWNLCKAIYIETVATHRINLLSDKNQIRYFFLDGNIKGLQVANRLDIDFSFLNLFDVKQYATYYQNASQVFISSYDLRGRSFLIRANYAF